MGDLSCWNLEVVSSTPFLSERRSPNFWRADALSFLLLIFAYFEFVNASLSASYLCLIFR